MKLNAHALEQLARRWEVLVEAEVWNHWKFFAALILQTWHILRRFRFESLNKLDYFLSQEKKELKIR